MSNAYGLIYTLTSDAQGRDTARSPIHVSLLNHRPSKAKGEADGDTSPRSVDHAHKLQRQALLHVIASVAPIANVLSEDCMTDCAAWQVSCTKVNWILSSRLEMVLSVESHFVYAPGFVSYFSRERMCFKSLLFLNYIQ